MNVQQKSNSRRSFAYWKEERYKEIAQYISDHGLPVTAPNIAAAVRARTGVELDQEHISWARLDKVRKIVEDLTSGIAPVLVTPSKIIPVSTVGLKPTALGTALVEARKTAEKIVSDVIPPKRSSTVDTVLAELIDDRLTRSEGKMIGAIRQLLDSQTAQIEQRVNKALDEMAQRLCKSWDIPLAELKQPPVEEPAKKVEEQKAEATPLPQVQVTVPALPKVLLYGIERNQHDHVKAAISKAGLGRCAEVDVVSSRIVKVSQLKMYDYVVAMKSNCSYEDTKALASHVKDPKNYRSVGGAVSAGLFHVTAILNNLAEEHRKTAAAAFK